MKKLVMLLAVLFMAGCMSTPKSVPNKDICETLRDRMPGKAVVIRDKMELDSFMYNLGGELAQEMARSDDNTACVYAHVYLQFADIESYGEVCAETREDGTYLIETSCDYKAGEEVKRRDHLEHRLF